MKIKIHNSTNILTHIMKAATERDCQKIIIVKRDKPIHTIAFRKTQELESYASRVKKLLPRGSSIGIKIIKPVSKDGYFSHILELHRLTSEPIAKNQQNEFAV